MEYYEEEDIDYNACVVECDGEDDHGAADHGVGDGYSGHEGGLGHIINLFVSSNFCNNIPRSQ